MQPWLLSSAPLRVGMLAAAFDVGNCREGPSNPMRLAINGDQGNFQPLILILGTRHLFLSGTMRMHSAPGCDGVGGRSDRAERVL